MEEKYNYLKPFEKVTFKKENGVWYFDYPEWVLSKASLSMVRGSDTLLDILAKDKNEITLKVSFQNKPLPFNRNEIIELIKDSGSLITGYDYRIHFAYWNIYLCPVTLAKFKCFPKYIYIIIPEDVNTNEIYNF